MIISPHNCASLIISLIISPGSYHVIIFVINLSLRFISRFGRFHEDFTLKEGTVPLPFSRNWPENHLHNLGKALGEGLGLLKTGSLSLSLSLSPLYPFHFSLSLISPSLSISLLLPFFLSLFSLSFSLAYLMDVFVLVRLEKAAK